MRAFISPLEQLKEFQNMKEKLCKKQGLFLVPGCVDSQKAHFIHAAGEDCDKKLIVTYSEKKAKELYEDYKFFDRNVCYYPARDLIFYNADIQGNLLVRERIQVIKRLLEEEQVTVITTIDGCMEHLIPLADIEERVITIRDTDAVETESLRRQLVQLGYEKNYQVEVPGQFALRGGIIDIFPLTEENPFRIELWGDEVDSIRSFDADSQRSIEQLTEIKIYPATEILLDEKRLDAGMNRIQQECDIYTEALRGQFKTKEAAGITHLTEELKEKLEYLNGAVPLESYVRFFYEDTVSLIDYFADDTLLVLDEPIRLEEKGEVTEAEFKESMISRIEKGYMLPGQAEVLFGYEEIQGRINRRGGLALCVLEQRISGLDICESYPVVTKAVNPYNSSFELLTKDLLRWKKSGYKVILMSASRTRALRLAEDLREYDLNSYYISDLDREVQSGEILVVHGHVLRGYEYPLIKFVVISESDIFGRDKKKKKKKKHYEGSHIASFSELKPGDYVVHESHGLGIYRGLGKVAVDKTVKDYIKIEYAAGGNLYIPATQLDLIQKYADSKARKPKLHRLGGAEWNRTKTRVRSAVKEIAGDLVKLYAARQERSGYRYGPDTVWQKEFEEMFPFEETEDQLQAIEATKRDMESERIMDRLICGDVGYGKTEIAIRAAFKAVQENKQVVYLVPTTILAQQHYNTFVQRMKDFPIRIDLLCRFRTAAQQKDTLENVRKGQVDIVIGTHRVLSKDVVFKDLGLLVVDEEQRFGVTHKEKIKQLKENVDVLTLTATPIPRTLHMSLIGIRDMSVLEEPPMDRVPIQTYVMEYNEEMVREAINRELARDGQIYYVYNRVEHIQDVTATIAGLVPEANVSYAHGQMPERDLEKIMFGFINREIDVLVSTTIIETGLDISNVNTIIIHDADNMGLSQLYQLRGRVGRSNRTAYAFLMYRRNKMLPEVAEKRLHAIREFTDLGSGFKIAMRDLEIRGAGNLLGAEQHGHMEAVGYDLYCKMLNDAVKKLKGESPGQEYETTVDLDINAYIPATYIPNEYHKLDIYKRIASIENSQEYEDMLEEMIDRFGEPPKEVVNLLEIALLKVQAHDCYLLEITEKNHEIKFLFFEKAAIDPVKIPAMVEKYGSTLVFKVDVKPYFIYQRKKKKAGETLSTVKKVLNDIKTLID